MQPKRFTPLQSLLAFLFCCMVPCWPLNPDFTAKARSIGRLWQRLSFGVAAQGWRLPTSGPEAEGFQPF
jgi:hypothetical protein